jgi:TMEM175 potassium channel family protein
VSEEDQRRPDELPLGRLDAFSDGVFAIAITLLVLELGVAATAATDLAGAIVGLWPAYLAYITSFLTIGVMWLRHTTITSMMRAGDSVLFRLNLVVLLLAAFLPFPTKLVGEFIGEREPEQVAVLFYGIVLLLLDLSMVAFASYAVEERRLVKPSVTDERLREVTAPISLAFYGVAMIIGLLLPTIGVLLYLAIAVYVGIPGKTIRRLLRTAGLRR